MQTPATSASDCRYAESGCDRDGDAGSHVCGDIARPQLSEGYPWSRASPTAISFKSDRSRWDRMRVR